MNSASGRMIEVEQTRHGIYFFLSYAHSAPTSEWVRSDVDSSVRVFFADLSAAVAARARPAPGPRKEWRSASSISRSRRVRV
jgi:hypothetical protein